MSRIFLGGVPTGPDVARLMALDPRPGLAVGYAEIEAAIGVDRRSSRFRTVINAWRDRVFRELRLQSAPQGGALLFLTAEQAHEQAIKGLFKARKGTERTLVKAQAVDRRELPPGKARQHDFLCRELHLLRESMAKSAIALAPPAPSTSRRLPRQEST